MTCVGCNKKDLSNDEIALCKKLLGRETEAFYCLECLADFIDCTVDDLLIKIEEFKEQGCALFS